MVALDPSRQAAFERSYTDQLRPRNRWLWPALGAVVLAGAIGGVVALVTSARQADKLDVVLPAPPPPTPRVTPLATPPPPPKATPADDESKRGIGENGGAKLDSKSDAPTTFDPDPVTKRPPVQFVFHVWPRGAEVLVDDKKVEGNKLTLPYQARAHHVLVRAPGYHTIVTSAPSTANRTFELRMDRIVVRAKPKHDEPAPPPKPAHDAAPVQDL